MESAMAFIIFIALIATFFHFNSPLEKESAVLQQASVSQEQSEKQSLLTTGLPKASANSKKPSIFIDTSIIFGPKEGEIIEETNEVTFEFEAKIIPETKEQIYFETKIEGFDNDWVKIYYKERTVSFPPGSKEYTFLVRARTGNFVDFTPAKRTFRINISPYFKKVRIYSVQNKTSYEPSLITLGTTLKREERINITNWYLEGKGGKVAMPKGVEKYYHYYNLPQPEDIFITYGDAVYLSSGFNPLGRNRNFRPNKCMGYLVNSFDFSVSISKNCPGPTNKEISHLEPCCQEFIRYLTPCEVPDYSERPKIYSDPECVSYLNENFNNVGCFKNYSQDKDFLENIWHIYLNGKDITVSNDCDIIYLHDQDGLVIDKHSYGYAVCW